MFHISDAGVTYLNRGDSMKTSLCLNCGTALVPIQYILKDEDTVYFALMEPNSSLLVNTFLLDIKIQYYYI